MPSKKTLTFCVVVLTVVLGSLTIARPLLATSSDNVLYSFCSTKKCHDGANPLYGNLVADKAGNLYGTASAGGVYGFGAVFQLVPGANGKWKEKVLHSFRNTANDGGSPFTGLIFDAAGNLYGATAGGGVANALCGDLNCGVVFQLVPESNGTWKENVLYRFCSLTNCTDGVNPYGGLIFDAAGNLYGTTFFGGQGIGTVYELIPGSDGQWTEKVLYDFCSVGGCKDGFNPSGSLIFDGAGNLYGTASGGGPTGYGIAYELTLGTNGTWKEKVLHNFGLNHDGILPFSGMIFDTAGNLYGTCGGGGAPEHGIVFQLTSTNGKWKETRIDNFKGADGGEPFGSLVFDTAGNLYGTTIAGGASGVGTVFQLVEGSNGKWTENLLYSFQSSSSDGNSPYGGLIFGPDGNLYGTTNSGGANNAGTVFEIAP